VRTLVHLSDLHFGRIAHAVIEPLLSTVAELTPDVVAVSGDLTQRAHTQEFKAARAFLDALPSPQIVVPGNHDVPLYNLFGRFFHSLTKYRRYISDDLAPFYADEEIAILGINTARALTVKGGRINITQVARIRERLGTGTTKATKILVTHHPFELPPDYHRSDIVGRARMVMETLAACGVDVLLAGHMHRTYAAHTATRYGIRGHSALVVQAGTATSTRERGEANAFNVLRIAHPHITVRGFVWQPERSMFMPDSTRHFRFTPEGWVASSDAP
jgi:3',5'-cyclic AMP phosphodiesterase CpdA